MGTVTRTGDYCTEDGVESGTVTYTTPDPCQLCAYLRHGGPVGHLPQCTSNETCADAANHGETCPCQSQATTNRTTN